MKYTFVFKESQDGTPILIVYQENEMNLFGLVSPKVVNVFTGKEATEMYDRLTDRVKEVDHE